MNCPAIQRGNRVDANAVRAVGARLVDSGGIGMNLDNLQQKIL